MLNSLSTILDTILYLITLFITQYFDFSFTINFLIQRQYNVHAHGVSVLNWSVSREVSVAISVSSTWNRVGKHEGDCEWCAVVVVMPFTRYRTPVVTSSFLVHSASGQPSLGKPMASWLQFQKYAYKTTTELAHSISCCFCKM